jgi:hypothetical protein
MSVRAGGQAARPDVAPGSALRWQDQHERDKHQRCLDLHRSIERQLPEVGADESHQPGLRPPSSGQEKYAGGSLALIKREMKYPWWVGRATPTCP